MVYLSRVGVKMKKERKTLYFSILVNMLVSFLKIGGGLVFGMYSLIADGYYSICDLATDFIALISAKISRKRANKKFPFGYGKVEYIAQMFIGFLIIGVGLFTFLTSFGRTFERPGLDIIYVILVAIFLKTLSSNYLYQVGKDIRSQILISSAGESFLDVISTTGVLIVVLIGQLFPPIDFLGSTIISVLIMAEGVKIITNNLWVLVGEDKNDQEIKNKLKNIVNNSKLLTYSDSFLIKSGSYYQTTIELAVPKEMTVRDLLKWENKIKKQIKDLKYNIKFIDFEIITK